MNIRQYLSSCVTLLFLLGSVDLCAVRASAAKSVTFTNETDTDILVNSKLVPSYKSTILSVARGSNVVISDPQHHIGLTSVSAYNNSYKIRKEESNGKQWFVVEQS
jgi:hypothetical protein